MEFPSEEPSIPSDYQPMASDQEEEHEATAPNSPRADDGEGPSSEAEEPENDENVPV